MTYRIGDSEWHSLWEQSWQKRFDEIPSFVHTLTQNLGFDPDSEDFKQKRKNIQSNITRFKKAKKESGIKYFFDNSSRREAFCKTLGIDEFQLNSFVEQIANKKPTVSELYPKTNIELQNPKQGWLEPSFIGEEQKDSMKSLDDIKSILNVGQAIVIVRAKFGKTRLANYLNCIDSKKYLSINDKNQIDHSKDTYQTYTITVDNDKEEQKQALYVYQRYSSNKQKCKVSLLIMVNEKENIVEVKKRILSDFKIQNQNCHLYNMQVSLDYAKAKTVIETIHDSSNNDTQQKYLLAMKDFLGRQDNQNWPYWCYNLDDFMLILKLAFDSEMNILKYASWETLLSELLSDQIAQLLPNCMTNKNKVVQDILALFVVTWLKQSLEENRNQVVRYKNSVLIKPNIDIFKQIWKKTIEAQPKREIASLMEDLDKELAKENAEVSLEKLRLYVGTWEHVDEEKAIETLLSFLLLWRIAKVPNCYHNVEQPLTKWLNQILHNLTANQLESLFPKLMYHVNDSLLDTGYILQHLFKKNPHLVSKEFDKTLDLLPEQEASLIVLICSSVTDNITENQVKKAWECIFQWWDRLSIIATQNEEELLDYNFKEYHIERVYLGDWLYKFAHRNTKFIRSVSQKYCEFLPFIATKVIWQQDYRSKETQRADWFQWSKVILDKISGKKQEFSSQEIIGLLDLIPPPKGYEQKDSCQQLQLESYRILEWEPLDWLGKKRHPEALKLLSGEIEHIIARYPQQCIDYLGKGPNKWGFSSLPSIIVKYYFTDIKVKSWYVKMSLGQRKEFFMKLILKCLDGNILPLEQIQSTVTIHNPDFLTDCFFKENNVYSSNNDLHDIALFMYHPGYSKDGNEKFLLWFVENVGFQAYEEILSFLFCLSSEELQKRHDWLLGLGSFVTIRYLTRLHKIFSDYLDYIQNSNIKVCNLAKFVKGYCNLLQYIQTKIEEEYKKHYYNERSLRELESWYTENLSHMLFRNREMLEISVCSWILRKWQKLSFLTLLEFQLHELVTAQTDRDIYKKLNLHLLPRQKRLQCYRLIFPLLETHINEQKQAQNDLLDLFFYLLCEEKEKLIPEFMEHFKSKKKNLYEKWQNQVINTDHRIAKWIPDEYMFFSAKDSKVLTWWLEKNISHLAPIISVNIAFGWMDEEWIEWLFETVESECPTYWLLIIKSAATIKLYLDKNKHVEDLHLSLNKFLKSLDENVQKQRAQDIFSGLNRNSENTYQVLNIISPWVISLLKHQDMTIFLEAKFNDIYYFHKSGNFYDSNEIKYLSKTIAIEVGNILDISSNTCCWKNFPNLSCFLLQILQRNDFLSSNVHAKKGEWCKKQIEQIIALPIKFWEQEENGKSITLEFYEQVLEMLPCGYSELYQKCFQFMMDTFPKLYYNKPYNESYAVECIRIVVERLDETKLVKIKNSIPKLLKKCEKYQNPYSIFLVASLLEVIIPHLFQKNVIDEKLYSEVLSSLSYMPLISMCKEGDLQSKYIFAPMLEDTPESLHILEYYLRKIASINDVASIIRAGYYQESLFSGWINWNNWSESKSRAWKGIDKKKFAKVCRNLGSKLQKIIHSRSKENPKEKEIWQALNYITHTNYSQGETRE